MSRTENQTPGKLQAAELDASLEVVSHNDEIESLRAAWESDMDNDLRRFQYASVLARSCFQADRQEALIHLGFLVTSSTEYHRDALYLLTVTKYLEADYDGARGCAEELCRVDPDNIQVKNLFAAIKYKHERALQKQRETDQAVGVAVGVGVGVAALGIGLSFLLSKRR